MYDAIHMMIKMAVSRNMQFSFVLIGLIIVFDVSVRVEFRVGERQPVPIETEASRLGGSLRSCVENEV